MVESSDREIIQKVLDGSAESYRHLVRRYEQLVYCMVRRQVDCDETAKELAQDTFVKAYNGLRKFEFQCKFSTWLVRIALNTTRSYYSSKRFKERKQTLILDYQLAGSIKDNTSEALEKEYQSYKLEAALGGLKPKYRDVIVLCYLEKHSYSEAGEILGIPSGTVCSRLHTALKRLSDNYERIENE